MQVRRPRPEHQIPICIVTRPPGDLGQNLRSTAPPQGWRILPPGIQIMVNCALRDSLLPLPGIRYVHPHSKGLQRKMPHTLADLSQQSQGPSSQEEFVSSALCLSYKNCGELGLFCPQHLTASITLHLLNDSESLAVFWLSSGCFQRRNLRPLSIGVAACPGPGHGVAGNESQLRGVGSSVSPHLVLETLLPEKGLGSSRNNGSSCA